MSDAVTNKTTLAGTPVTVAEARTLYYYDKIRIFAGLVGPRYLLQVPRGVSTRTVVQQDYMTLAAQTEATQYDALAFTTTARTFTPVVYTASVMDSWIAEDSTNVDLTDAYAESAATAWAYLEDDSSVATKGFAGTYGEAPSTGPDHELGTDTVALTAQIIRTARQLLRTSGARMPYNFVIDPIQTAELMADAEFRQFTIQPAQVGYAQYAASTGVSMDRFLGVFSGVNIWEANAMVESSGLHAIMFGQGALGKGYKLVSTPLSPTPAELNIERSWQPREIGWRTSFTVCMDIHGCGWTSTTNKFMVDIIS